MLGFDNSYLKKETWHGFFYILTNYSFIKVCIMKKRTINYLNRKKAFRDMIQFKDLTSFLLAGLRISKSAIVKKDIARTILQLQKMQPQPVLVS